MNPNGSKENNVHPATSPKQCEVMADRNGWDLIRVVETGVRDLPVDCVFAGPQTEFPNLYADLDDD